jgi:hypothetical protein
VVGIVLGVSMAPTKVRMVLVEGENADGVTLDEDEFDVTADTSPSTAATQVISAILGTREGADEAGLQLLSTGVTCDYAEAAVLRDALIAHKVENVMLVSAFMAAAALAQAVGDATNYANTALLFVEPYTATLAVVGSADGSIAEVHRRLLPDDEDHAVAELVELVSGAESLQAHPDGLFVVGSGVDIPMIKPVLEAATSLQLSTPEEPDIALARGAALASANAPLFASSTAALAYSLDPGTDEVVDPPARQLPVIVKAGKDYVAYSAVPDEEADANTGRADHADDAGQDESASRRRPVLLAGSALAVIFISAVVALEIALAISIRPTVALRPNPNHNLIVPAQQPPAPAQAAVPQHEVPLPNPVAVPKSLNLPAPAPMPRAPAPLAVPVAPVPAPIPMVPAHVPGVEPRGHFGGEPRFGGGHGEGAFRHGPFGGWHGGFGGGHGGFGGGHGFGGFGGGHGFGGFGRR